MFVNGVQKSPAEQNAKQKRWVDTRGIQAPAGLHLANPNVLDDPSVEEIGDFQSKEDKEFRVNAEKEKPRITWNAERRCYLSQTSFSA